MLWYVHIYVLAFIYTYIRTSLYAYILNWFHTYIYTYSHTYIHTFVRPYMHTYLIAFIRTARISLTLSCHFSLSLIASGRSSGLHPVSSHSCWMYVRAGRPAFAQLCVGVHKSISLLSSSLFLQQCPACLVRLTWIVFVIGGRWPYSWWIQKIWRSPVTFFVFLEISKMRNRIEINL